MKPFVSLIIPSHNAIRHLPLMLVDMHKNLSGEEYPSEVIVVDHGSADATAEMARRFTHINKTFRLIEGSGQNRDWAIKEGMGNARGRIRVILDADTPISLKQLRDIISYFHDGYEVVIGWYEPTKKPSGWFSWLNRKKPIHAITEHALEKMEYAIGFQNRLPQLAKKINAPIKEVLIQ